MTWGKVFREILGKVSSLLRRYEDTASPLPLDVSYLDMTLQTITHLGTRRGVRLRTKPTQGRTETKRITKKQTQSQTFCSWTFCYTKEFFSLLVKSAQVRVSVPYTPKHPTCYIIYMCHFCIRPSSQIIFPYAVAPQLHMWGFLSFHQMYFWFPEILNGQKQKGRQRYAQLYKGNTYGWFPSHG